MFVNPCFPFTITQYTRATWNCTFRQLPKRMNMAHFRVLKFVPLIDGKIFGVFDKVKRFFSCPQHLDQLCWGSPIKWSRSPFPDDVVSGAKPWSLHPVPRLEVFVDYCWRQHIIHGREICCNQPKHNCTGKRIKTWSIVSRQKLPTLKHVVFLRKYRVSQEECVRLRESVPYVKLYRYNPKHLYPNLNGYGANGHRKVWASGVSTYCTPSVTPYSSTAHARQRDTAS